MYDNLFKKHILCIIYYYNFMFSSDLRQILPMIPKGTSADEINARIKIIPLMERYKLFKP